MLKAKFHHKYRKTGTGNLVFVYEVSGKAADLADYKDAQGSNYIEDDESGKPLFFTTRPFIGGMGELGISSEGNVYQDTSKLDEAKAITEANGGNFGDLLGARLLDGIFGAQQVSTSVSTPEPASTPSEDDVENL